MGGRGEQGIQSGAMDSTRTMMMGCFLGLSLQRALRGVMSVRTGLWGSWITNTRKVEVVETFPAAGHQ